MVLGSLHAASTDVASWETLLDEKMHSQKLLLGQHLAESRIKVIEKTIPVWHVHVRSILDIFFPYGVKIR